MQPDLLTDVPFLSPREQGLRAAAACEAKAVRVTSFNTGNAKVFVLGYLAKHGPSWGEAIVDAATDAGRVDLTGHDRRCWGNVFAGLVRESRIVCLRSDGARKHGHATSGARLWGLPR